MSVLLSCNYTPSGSKAVPLPEGLAPAVVDAAGRRFQALAYNDSQASKSSFGFDIRGAGLLPVRISIDNRSGAALKIIPRQTFLIDMEGQAWPLLTVSQMFRRLESDYKSKSKIPSMPSLEEMESLTGFALDIGVSTDFQADTNAHARPDSRIDKDLQDNILHNPILAAGKVASGVLFFPGHEEANSARSLRLCIEQGGQLMFVDLMFKAFP